MSAALVFRALADDNRLEILSRVSTEPCRMHDLAEGLPITRQAVRKHLTILEQANLVRLKPNGREVLVTAQRQGITVGREFLEATERRWSERLGRLKEFVESATEPD